MSSGRPRTTSAPLYSAPEMTGLTPEPGPRASEAPPAFSLRTMTLITRSRFARDSLDWETPHGGLRTLF